MGLYGPVRPYTLPTAARTHLYVPPRCLYVPIRTHTSLWVPAQARTSLYGPIRAHMCPYRPRGARMYVHTSLDSLCTLPTDPIEIPYASCAPRRPDTDPACNANPADPIGTL